MSSAHPILVLIVTPPPQDGGQVVTPELATPTPTLPAGLLPRGLTKTQAAAYVGCATVRSFEAQIERGIFPGTMPGTRVWDRCALDAVMDRLSGLGGPGARLSVQDEADRLLAEWQEQQPEGRATKRR